MADIFTTAPGAVVAINSPGIPMNLFLEGWGGYPFYKSIITSFRVQTQSGVQFLHTLRDFIYVYSFGERIGDMTLSGVSFAFQCETQDILYHGLEYALAYYLLNRAATRPTPVTVVLGGGTPFFGFLVGMNMELADTERVLGNFNYTFKIIPNPSILDLLF